MALIDGVAATAANFNAAFVSTGGTNTFSGVQTFDQHFNFKEISAPSTPAANYVSIYAKTDSELYFKNDAGTESKLSNTQNIGYVTKTTTYTAVLTDYFILGSASGGSWTLTLPTAVGITGKIFIIGRSDQTLANAITVDGNASETINGSANLKLATQGERIKIVSDGTNWQLLERFIPSVWTAFTPTGSWVTNTTYTGMWRRSGDSIDLQYVLNLSGAPTSASLTLNIVSGLTMDNTKFIGAVYGTGAYVDAGSTLYRGGVDTISATQFACSVGESSSTYLRATVVTQAVPFTFGNTDQVYVILNSVPITGWDG